VKEIQSAVQEASAGRTNFTRNRDALLRAVDGLIYGDNPDQGIVRGNVFIHPPLRFRVDFPQTWDVQNSPDDVVVRKAPNQNVYMLFQAVPNARGVNVEQIAQQAMQGAGFRIQSGSQQTINGLDAYIGVYQGSLQGIGNVTMRAAHIIHNGNVYMLAGFSPPAGFEQEDDAFLKSIRSFRPLTAAEAEAVHPNRIDIYTVRQGDTWQSIADRGGVIKASTLAVMNGMEPASQPTVGERIKIVTGG
jgi:predicted Zn-dependent protease